MSKIARTNGSTAAKISIKFHTYPKYFDLYLDNWTASFLIKYTATIPMHTLKIPDNTFLNKLGCSILLTLIHKNAIFTVSQNNVKIIASV